jgi:hypothetical protein
VTADDDKRALERFVAGLDVDDDALATAITARAVDRTIVVEALLTALTSPHAAVRRRAAERIARMRDVAPRLAAELTLLAATDPDERAREAGAVALQAHGLLVPDATPPQRGSPERAPSFGERLLAFMWLRPMTVRSTQPGLVLLPRIRANAPSMRATLTVDDDGRSMLALSGLPAMFAATRPTVLVRRDPDADAYTEIGTALEPVSADGSATIRIEPEVGPADEVRRWLERDVQLVVIDR